MKTLTVCIQFKMQGIFVTFSIMSTHLLLIEGQGLLTLIILSLRGSKEKKKRLMETRQKNKETVPWCKQFLKHTDLHTFRYFLQEYSINFFLNMLLTTHVIYCIHLIEENVIHLSLCLWQYHSWCFESHASFCPAPDTKLHLFQVSS